MPTPQPQIVEIPLGLGIDTETDPRQLQKRLAVASHVRVDRAGRLSAVSRLETLSVSAVDRQNDDGGGTSKNLTNIAALYGRPDSAQLYSLSTETDPATAEGGYAIRQLLDGTGWKYTGRKSPFAYTVTPVSKVQQPLDQTAGSFSDGERNICTTALGNGFTLVAYRRYVTTASLRAYVDVFDSTGARVLTEFDFAGGAYVDHMHAVALTHSGTIRFYIFYTTGTPTLHAWSCDASALTPNRATYALSALFATSSGDFDVVASQLTNTVCYLIDDGATVRRLSTAAAGAFALDGSAATSGGGLSFATIHSIIDQAGTTERIFVIGHDTGTPTIRVNVHQHSATPTELFTNNLFNPGAAVLATACARARSYDSLASINGGVVVAVTYPTAISGRGTAITRFDLVTFAGAAVGASYTRTVYNAILVAEGFTYGATAALTGDPQFVLMPAPTWVLIGGTDARRESSRAPTYCLVSLREHRRDLSGGVPQKFNITVDGVMLTREAATPHSFGGAALPVQIDQLHDVAVSFGSAPKAYLGAPRQRQIDGLRPFATLADAVLLTMNFAHPGGASTPTDATVEAMCRRPLEVGQAYVLPGFLPQLLTADRSFELGFIQRPVILSLTAAASGNLDDGNTYSYIAVYEWNGPDGKLHRSMPSEAASIALSAGQDEVNAVVTTCTLSDVDNKIGEVRIALYRTTVTPGGANFYKVNTAANNPAAASVTINDGLIDSSAATNALLYTLSGELANSHPRAMKTAVARSDRIFYVSPDHPTRVYYSKPLTIGVAPEFDDGLYAELEAAVDIKAVELLDDNVVAFARGMILYFGGQGPNALGLGEFSPPRRIMTDAGGVDPYSVVAYDDGLMFKSQKGFRALNRGAQVDKVIGAPVRSYDAERIVSAIRVDGRPELRFNTDGSNILLYDYLHDAWTVGDTLALNEGTPNVSDAANTAGGLVQVLTPATVYREASGGNENPGSPEIETGWISTGALMAEGIVQRIELIGDLSSGLVINLYKDLESTPFETAQFSSSAGRQQLRVTPSTSRMQSIKVGVSRDGTTGAYSVSRLAVVMGARPDHTRNLAAAQSG